jgi:hypothetical protein
MKSKILCLLILLGWNFSNAQTDQITLKNADRVTGTVIHSDGKTLVLKSDLIGEITVALDNVTAIATDKPLYVTLG